MMATADILSLPVPNVDTVRDFLSTSIVDHIHIVVIAPDGQPLPYGRYFGSDAASAAAWAVSENAKGYGAYWTVNIVRRGLDKKPKKGDMVAARFCHVDIDPPKGGGPFDRAGKLDRLADFDAPPSLVIDSGNGLQPVWRLEFPAENMPVIERMNQSLEDMFGGDACYNIDRLLRLPGTVNHPNKLKRSMGRVPVLASVVMPDSGESIEPEDLRRLLPVPKPRQDAERAHVELGAIKALSLADLKITPFDPVFTRITAPTNPNRSAATYGVACELVRMGFGDTDIAGVLLNPDLAISAHCLDQPLAIRAATRAIAGARSDVAGEADQPKADRIKPQEPAAGVGLRDFYAHMPSHTYIFAPTREFWPSSSVNARIAPIAMTNSAGQPVMDDKGKPKLMPAAAWLDQERPIEQMTWAPGEPMIVEDRLISEGGWIFRAGCSCFNLYRPPMIEEGDATQAGRWVEHVRTVYPDEADHIISWLAHRVQRPHEKINHALVLGGSQGVGKDTILEPVKAAIGPWNFAEVSPQHMLGRFNGFVKSVILRVSEARDLGDVDRFAFYDHMKTYTAAPPDVLRVDEKHLREYSVFNVCGVIITSNHKTDGIFLPPDDRRHFVAWSDAVRESFTPDYWSGLYDWYAKGGSRHVAAYLRGLDLSGFNAKAPPPKTEAFWAIVGANRAPEDAELADALDRLGRPAATTIQSIGSASSVEFSDWLSLRANARRVPHRLEDCGYVAVRNSNAKDGHWVVSGKRQVVYARKEMTIRDQQAAAMKLTGTRF